jgi:hypothetical protein
VFENRVLRGIYGPKGGKATGRWRKLHNKELHYLYFSPNIIIVLKSSRIGWVGHVARRGMMSCTYRSLVGKSERKRPLGRLRHT